MDELPEECVEKVMSYVGPQQTCRLAVLSKTLWSASQSEQLWQSFLPACYESVISQSSSSDLKPLQGITNRQLVRRLCQSPILIDQGDKSWMLDRRTGKITMMVMIPNGLQTSMSLYQHDFYFKLRDTIHTQRVLLSPSTSYTAYLVLKLEKHYHVGPDPDPDPDPSCITAKVRRWGRGRGRLRCYLQEKVSELRFNASHRGHSGVHLECEAKLEEFWTKEANEKDEEVETTVVCDSLDGGELTFYGIQLRPNC
ncbi:Putative F-box protein PP2-B12 [Linum grandiflorum]